MKHFHRTTPSKQKPIVTTLSYLIFSCISFLAVAEDKTPEDNVDLLNQQQFFVGALNTGVVAGLVPVGAVSRPGELIEISTNLALKAIAPVLTIPDDLELTPNTDFAEDEQTQGEACYREFVLPDGYSQNGASFSYPYEDWFGFWNIKKLPTANEWFDFGSPSPFVRHANTGVELSLQLFGDVDENPNIITLPEGRYTIDWTATTQLSPFWDVALPVFLAIPNLNSETRYGEAAAKKVAKKFMQSFGKT